MKGGPYGAATPLPKNIGCVFIHKNGRQEVKYISQDQLMPTIVRPVEYRRNGTINFGQTGLLMTSQPVFGTDTYRYSGRTDDLARRHLYVHVDYEAAKPQASAEGVADPAQP